MSSDGFSRQHFFVVKHGKATGPFSLNELREMQLEPTDFVKAEGADDYKELREIPELCQALSIEYRRTLPQYFATMDMRLLAWAIDFFIVFAAVCVFFIAPVLIVAPESLRMQLIILSLLGIVPIQFIMSTIMESSERQGTFGKYFINIKVCDVEGAPIGFLKSLLRNCYKTIGFLSLGIGFFIGFFDRRQQCLHDKLAGTLVIRDRLI